MQGVSWIHVSMSQDGRLAEVVGSASIELEIEDDVKKVDLVMMTDSMEINHFS